MNQIIKDWNEKLSQLRDKMPPIVIISHDYKHKVYPDEFITIDSFSTIQNFSETKPIIKQ